jgi:hypothetical protein
MDQNIGSVSSRLRATATRLAAVASCARDTSASSRPLLGRSGKESRLRNRNGTV